MNHLSHVWTRAPCRNNQLRGVWRSASQLSCVSAAVVRLPSCSGQPAHDEKLPRSSGKNWQSCLLSSATPAPAQLARAPAPISHTLAGTQVGGRREDGGTLIWFLPRFEFKLERGGGLGWRSPHSLARYLRGIFCIFQKYITAYCIQSKCQKYLTFYSNVFFSKYFIYFFN